MSARIKFEDVYSQYKWKTEELWELSLPLQYLSINSLDWHLDIEFHWIDRARSSVPATPREVLANPSQYPEAHEQIMNVDTSWPLHVVKEANRWVILDGIRRLTKGYADGVTTLKIHILAKDLVT